MIEKYCSECGNKLELKVLDNEGIIPYCKRCNEFKFPKYSVAVSMIVINEENNKILLIQQYNKPVYILVAGYVNKGESLEEALKREIKEETGMSVDYCVYNKTKYFEPSNTLMCNFTAFVKNDKDFNPNREIDSYSWFSFDDAKINIKENSLAKEFLLYYLDKNKDM